MSENIKCAVIGAGLMGSGYVEIISKLRDTKLVGIADPKIEVRNEVKKNYGVNIYSTFEELLKKEELDAVVISCPDEYHAAAAVMALEQNIHVHLEKPVASTIVDCNRILTASIKSKAKINIGACPRTQIK